MSPNTEKPLPFSVEEVVALRDWHRQNRYKKGVCRQGDPWPCRTARFLATLDAQSNPKQIARFYAEWNERLQDQRRRAW